MLGVIDNPSSPSVAAIVEGNHMLSLCVPIGTIGTEQGKVHIRDRDANQYDFIIFSTIKRGKYDNTILP